MKKLFFLFASLAVIGFASCSKDDNPTDPITFKDVTLNVGDEYAIPNGGDAVWTSSNEWIATVSDAVVVAELEGEVEIKSDLGSFKVTVNATNKVVKEPCLVWDAEIPIVKEFMSSYNCVLDDDDDDDYLSYLGTGNVFLYEYYFEDNAMNMASMQMEEAKVSMAEIAEYCVQRYVQTYEDEDDGTTYWMTPDEKTVAYLYAMVVGDGFNFVLDYEPMPEDDVVSPAAIRAKIKARTNRPDVDKAKTLELNRVVKSLLK